jgi:hypothetical protein
MTGKYIRYDKPIQSGKADNFLVTPYGKLKVQRAKMPAPATATAQGLPNVEGATQ